METEGADSHNASFRSRDRVTNPIADTWLNGSGSTLATTLSTKQTMQQSTEPLLDVAARKGFDPADVSDVNMSPYLMSALSFSYMASTVGQVRDHHRAHY